MLGLPLNGDYHFEGEYCQITCGADADGFVYKASHDVLVCHDHQWVTQTLEPAVLNCVSMPCFDYSTSPYEEAPPNTQYECNSTPINTGNKQPSYNVIKDCYWQQLLGLL